MEPVDFVARHLPPPPSRVLEVGCGAGELALALAKTGYHITAIDPEAPDGPFFERISLEDFDAERSFDAVVASRSLHHVEDLEGGLDKLRTLLRPEGLLVLFEFAWDQMDGDTARWYLSHVDTPTHKDETLLPGNFPDAWIAEHSGLHSSKTLLGALDRRFRRQLFEWIPYLAEHYLGRSDLVPEEKRLIEAGKIKPIGFQYVGRRP
jgi:SAM-dependent methyltransferase